MPSSVRLFQWVDAGGQRQAPPRVAQGHDEPGTPLVWRGFQFKEILEYPGLPSVARMADDFSRITELSDATLISRIEIYSKLLGNRYATDKQRTPKWPSDLFENKNYWRQMSREEMESALVIEYMKYALGKSRPEEVREFLGLNR
jgi:hypothetical protein